MGKWVGVTRVRNECDIIEMFVRQNLSVLDELHIIINNNTDSTVEILSELRKEGLPIIPYNDTFLHNPQEVVISKLLNTQLDASECEWCFPLDADEFITVSRQDLAAELREVPAGTLAGWTWKTYVPLERLDEESRPSDQGTNPFHSIRYCRDPEPASCDPKIIIPSRLFASIRVSAGSFMAWDENDVELPVHMLSSRLTHIPVRSTEQLISKYCLGELSLRMKRFRGVREGYHWTKEYAAIKSGRTPTVTGSAMSFGTDGKSLDGDIKLKHEPIDWAPSALIKSDTKRKPSAFLNLLSFAELVVLRLNEVKDQLSKNEFSTDVLATKACKHGLFAFYKNDLVIGRSMELYGEWGEHELDCLSAYVQEGDVVVDVGANIGTHAVFFAKKVGEHGVVHAFEPQRRTFHLLNMNAALNECDNLTAHPEALGASTATVPVPDVGYDLPANIGNVSLLNGGGDTARMITLDSLELGRIRLMKIDVEGMEREVILGAKHTIARCHPILFVENNIEERSAHLLQALSDLDYRLYWHFAPYYNEGNFFGNSFNFLEAVERPEINILALPATLQEAPPNLEPVSSVSDSWREAYDRARRHGRSYL